MTYNRHPPKMTKPVDLFLPLLVLLTLTGDPVTSSIEQPGGSICPVGTVIVDDVEITHCIYIGTAATWKSARDFCLRNDAVLYNHDRGLRSQFGRRPLSDYLMTNGINRTWSGAHVEYGKLAQDIPNPPGVLTGQGEYVWDTGQPLDDKHCGSVTLRSNVVPDFANPEGSGVQPVAPVETGGLLPESTLKPETESPINVPDKTDGRAKRQVPSEGLVEARLSLSSCDEELPFVCLSNPLSSVIRMDTVSICENGTVGNYALKRCYSLSDSRATYEEASSLCQEKGGQLAGANNPYTNKLVRAALVSLMRLRATPRDDQPMQLPITSTWVYTNNNCNVVDYTMSEERYHWDCNAQLHYVCEIPAQLDGNIAVKVIAKKVSSVTPLATSGDSEIIIRYEDIRKEEAMAPSLICKVTGYNPELHHVAWYRNGEVFQSWLYKTIGDEIYLNLTTRIANRQGNIGMVGYYWCEVTMYERSVSSNRIFVRFLEMELHAGGIETKEETRDIPRQYSLFNLIGVSSKTIQTATRSFQVIETSPFPVFIRALRFRNNGTNMDFLSYRDRTSTRGFQLQELLQLARDELKQGFEFENGGKYFNTDTLQVRNIDYCLSFTYTYQKTGQKFNITQTMVGATFYTSAICGVNKQPMVMGKCLGDKMYGAYWGELKFNKACDFSDIEDTGISNALKNLSETEVTKDNVDDVIQDLVTITEDQTFSELDLLYTATVLENAANVSTLTPKVAENIYRVYNKILDSSDEALQQSQERGGVTNRVLSTMDSVAERLEQQPSGYQRIVTESFGTEVWDLTNPSLTNLVIGLQFTEKGLQPILRNESLVSIYTRDELEYGETVAAIIFPKNFVQQIVDDAKGKDIRLAMQIYKDTRLFTVSENSTGQPVQYVLNSKVIAAKILADGQSITDLKGAEVTTVFMPTKIISDDVRGNLSACGYWNFTAENKTGGWSTDGCRYVRQEGGRDVCVCDHLTNFAVLLDFYGQETLPPEHTLPLSIITIIGLSLSILGLTLTVLSFITFKKLRQTRPQQTLFNLAVAELCSWVVFLAGINQTQDHVGCIVVAVLLHYFIIASFMWMFMEALLHYLMFVKVLGTYFNRYMLKTTIPAWGIPILPVIIVLAVDTNLYRGGESYCWMSLTAFYYAFALPVGLIILANLIIYIMVVVSICRRSKATSQSSQSDRDRTIVNVRAAFFCFILLGLSWVFGYLTLSGARIAFQYVFTITTTIQGFLIFILFTLRDKKVRDSWRALCCKKKKKDGPSSGGRAHSLSDNLPLNKSNSNDSGSSNRTNATGISSVPYYNGYEHQFDDLRRMSQR